MREPIRGKVLLGTGAERTTRTKGFYFSRVFFETLISCARECKSDSSIDNPSRLAEIRTSNGYFTL